MPKSVLALFFASIASALFAAPNPASEHCAQQGGRTEIRKTATGGAYGVCVWYYNQCGMYVRFSECEEWELFHGQCQKGQCASVDAFYSRADRFTVLCVEPLVAQGN